MNPNAKLIVRFIKLVGGNVLSGAPTYNGGSILIQSDGGELYLFSSIISDNQAWYYGGGISAFGDRHNKKTIVNMYNSVIDNNRVFVTVVVVFKCI